MGIFDDKSLINQISDTCFSMQANQNSQLDILKKQLKQNKKEIDNVMSAIRAGIITKSTKAILEKLEQEQENIEIEIAKEQIQRPIISKEQIEFWIMKFANTDLTNYEQKQRLIDIFINSVHVYEDKMVMLFNYKDGEKCLSFNDFKNGIKKENTQINECSSLIKVGDPYGN